MQLTPYQIIETIVLSEKSAAAQEHGKYTFRVHGDANKISVRKAIESIYPNVKVKDVNMMNCSGKKRRTGKTQKMGQRSDWKKAIVTLKEGTIELA